MYCCLSIDGDGGAVRPWPLYPPEGVLVPNIEKADCAPGPYWTGVENRRYLIPTGGSNTGPSILWQIVTPSTPSPKINVTIHIFIQLFETRRVLRQQSNMKGGKMGRFIQSFNWTVWRRHGPKYYKAFMIQSLIKIHRRSILCHGDRPPDELNGTINVYRQVAGSIPDGVIGIFQSHNPSGRTMALGSTQPLTEMSTRCISWG